jgi:hypothetical protein
VEAEGSAINASMSAASNAAARMDWRERNSSREIGPTSRSVICSSRWFHAQCSSLGDARWLERGEADDNQLRDAVQINPSKTKEATRRVLVQLLVTLFVCPTEIVGGSRGWRSPFSKRGGTMLAASLPARENDQNSISSRIWGRKTRFISEET